MDFTAILVALIGSSVLNTLLNYWLAAREKRNNKHREVQHSLRLLMKNELRTLCRHYLQQEWIYEDELEDLIDMHACYHDDLKGNGYLDNMMARVKELEIRGIGVD